MDVQNSIPKIIHYCWFGNNEKPQEVLDLIDGWKHKNPDYTIKEWNESNFDLNMYDYAKEAYESKRFAFVTDIVRLYALYNEGGIYMDTDVEVLKPFDDFLHHQAFTGCETPEMCVTGTMASRKNNVWIKSLLEYYDNRKFLDENGKVDLTTNTKSITNITIDKFNWEKSDLYQDLVDVAIYPSDVFCAKSYKTGVVSETENTVTIHHFKGSWKTESEKAKSKYMTKAKNLIIRVVGEKNFNRINSVRGK